MSKEQPSPADAKRLAAAESFGKALNHAQRKRAVKAHDRHERIANPDKFKQRTK